MECKLLFISYPLHWHIQTEGTTAGLLKPEVDLLQTPAELRWFECWHLTVCSSLDRILWFNWLIVRLDCRGSRVCDRVIPTTGTGCVLVAFSILRTKSWYFRWDFEILNRGPLYRRFTASTLKNVEKRVGHSTRVHLYSPFSWTYGSTDQSSSMKSTTEYNSLDEVL